MTANFKDVIFGNRELTLTTATVAASLASRLVEFALSKGADRAALLSRAGVDPSALQDADGRLDWDRYVALMRAAKALTDDEALALRFGAEVDLAEFSIIGALRPPERQTDNLVSHTNRYAPLLLVSGNGPRFELRRRRGRSWLIDARPSPNTFPELTESTFARIVSTMRRAGLTSAVQEIRVTHSAPAHRSAYDCVFGVPVVFDSARNELLIDDSLLNQPEVRPDYAYGILRDHAERLLEKLKQRGTVRDQVEQVLASRLPDQPIDARSTARAIGVSRQTLFRRLALEGTSFEQVRDELRSALAKECLRSGDGSVAHVAWLTGFSDRAAFSRAFQRWTGIAPAAWRKLARRASP